MVLRGVLVRRCFSDEADIDDDAKEIVYRNYVDISVAVSSPNGLVVPVIRNVEDMSKN